MPHRLHPRLTPAWLALFGLQWAEVAHAHIAWSLHVHPEDWAAVALVGGPVGLIVAWRALRAWRARRADNNQRS